MRILYTGGSSGGHIFPIIALNRALKNEAAKLNIPVESYFCGAAVFSQDFYKKEGIIAYFISGAKLRRYFSFLNLLDPFKFLVALLKSLFIVWKVMPDIVFAKGGYDSVPVGLVAWLYRIPLIIHESDSIPGLANKILSSLATRIAVSFPFTEQFFPKEKTAITGNIIRQKPDNLKDIRKELNISRPIILVLGGSLGAKRLNDLIAGSLSYLRDKYFIALQCGANNYDELQQELSLIYQIDPTQNKNFKLFPFLDELDLASYLNAADLVISRAGSGSIFEIANWAKPSILIPLPDSASEHQQKNAFLYARQGAAVVLDQNNLTPQLLIAQIDNILQDLILKEKMSQAARAFFNQNAAQILAHEILNILNLKQPEPLNEIPAQKEKTDSNSAVLESNDHLSAQDRIYLK